MQKITPFLWFEDQAEEAMEFYTSLFEDSRIHEIARYPDAAPDPAMTGKVMTGGFELAGTRFLALDGGSRFKPTPAISFFVDCPSKQEVTRLFGKLEDGGSVLMPLQAYPFSDWYAWVQDRYGISWQLNRVGGDQRITPAFLFVGDQHGNAEAAMEQYVSLFPDSRIATIARYGPDEGGQEGAVKYAEFVLNGQDFKAMENDREHPFTFTEGVSFQVDCGSQEEVDRFWDNLSAGGEIQQCGWLKDRFGVSWQIIPDALPRLLKDPDPARAQRAMEAMLQMQKIDIRGLEAAAQGKRTKPAPTTGTS